MAESTRWRIPAKNEFSTKKGTGTLNEGYYV